MDRISDIHAVHIREIDLNLLRLFDAVYRLRSVSRAAEALQLSQPAASQGLGRLRLQVRDALFVRAGGGVRPTPRADRLAVAVQAAIATLEEALNEGERLDPRRARLVQRLHLSDIGEARFLPELMATLHREAPSVQVQSFPLPHAEIAGALDGGVIDFAIGFLPTVRGTQRSELLRDRYAVLLRAGHPLVNAKDRRGVRLSDLARLEYAAVRSHSETLRILQQLHLQERLRLTAAHFLALPAIVKRTDLAVVMPRNIARGFAAGGEFALIEPRLPQREFTVSLHWSRRFEPDPVHRWMRQLLLRLFKEG
jgi:DNA-binding transcriptional LysR family regulator